MVETTPDGSGRTETPESLVLSDGRRPGLPRTITRSTSVGNARLRLLALCAVLLSGSLVPLAEAATPKPWMWSPTRMNTRLAAASPFVWDTFRVKTAACTGTSKAVSGRYTRFRCQMSYGDANGTYAATVLTRVLAVGSGKLCVVANADGKALPHKEGTKGITVADGRACPM